MAVTASCSNPRPDDIFDDSSSNRMNTAIAECNDILRSKPEGWILQYYPEAGRSYGGFVIFFKFSAGDNVLISSEVDANATVESLYSIGADYGLTLNFDTYNRMLHYYSDPNTSAGGGIGFGYEGDYEFRVNSFSDNAMELIGKKTGNRMPFASLASLGFSTWPEYYAKIAQIRQYVGTYYNVTIDGERYSFSAKTGSYSILTLRDGNTGSAATASAWVPTATGIRLYEPITVAGQIMSEFAFTLADRSLTETTTGLKLSYSATP